MVRGTSKLPGRMTSRNTVADFPPKDQRDEAGFEGPLNRTSSFASLFVASCHRPGDRHHKIQVRRVTPFPNRSRRYPTWKSGVDSHVVAFPGFSGAPLTEDHELSGFRLLLFLRWPCPGCAWS